MPSGRIPLFVCIAFSGLCGFPATSVVCRGGSDDLRAVVQADWQRQEQEQRRGGDVTDTAALERLIRRGRLLADDLETRGAGQAAQIARRTLDDFQRRAAGGQKQSAAANTDGPDGFHLVGVSVGGGGALDPDRVKGKDWTYSPGDGARLGGPRTLSWDEREVLYRFRGLAAGTAHRLRLVFANNTRRAQAVTVNGPRRSALVARVRSRVPALQPLYYQARWAVRELVFANPLLDFDSVVFVRRHWPSIGHQCAHRVGETQRPGATLCVLTGLRGDGQVRDIPGDRLPPGGVGRFDLSFDGRRTVFPYAAPRQHPKSYSTGFGLVPLRFTADGGPDDTDTLRGGSGNQGGSCHMYDIYEISLDGSGLRKVAGVDYAEDTEPCYLPDGRIAFTSSRDGRLVQCGDSALVNALYTVNADGSDPQSITEPKEGEFYPSLLNDGRLIYTRWDYVMKPFNMIQQLWTVFPDGRAAELAYGDHYTFSPGPIAFFEARQVPGTSWVVTNGAAHHNTGGGPVVLVDLSRNRGGPEGMRNVTPEVGYPERGPAGMGGWFASPYPLAMEHFLVVYSMESRDNVSQGYGLYLLDVFGNLELIHRDPQMSVYSPMPLRSRPRPQPLPDAVSDVPESKPATVFVHDVFAGLQGVPRGTIKYLRVLESHDKREYCRLMFLDLGLRSGTDPRSVVGHVPVERDGSVAVQLEPRRNYFFELVDADRLEIRRMKNYRTLQPGEVRGCVGCHHHGGATPPSGGSLPLALRKPPAEPAPPPWGTAPMDFRHVVQPVLDRHCVGCHDGSQDAEKSFDLRGLRWDNNQGAYTYNNLPNLQFRFTDSYLALMPHVRIDPVGDYDGSVTPMAPYAVGSAVSPLMKLLRAGHYDVDLPADDWLALACWIDCNAPFYGGYEGDGPVPRWHSTHVFSRRPIRWVAHGLDPDTEYRLGVSWWDYGGQQVSQSLTVETFDGQRRFPLLSQQPLPIWPERSETPAERNAVVPQEAYADGQLKIEVSAAPGKTTALCELWLLETPVSEAARIGRIPTHERKTHE